MRLNAIRAQLGFAKSNANKCLKLENCVTMQNVTHCSSCADEYWADSASGECKKCWADNCKIYARVAVSKHAVLARMVLLILFG